MTQPCPICGAPLEIGSAFCGNCGNDLRVSRAETIAGDGPLPAGRAPNTGPLPTQGPLIGRELMGQYIVRRRLGEGGMGEVYYADQPSVGRAAAIKVLHAQYTRDPAQRERFNQEAKAAAKLTSAHIVSIYNYGETEDGMAFLAMEYLEGRTLAQLLHQEGAIHPSRVVKIAAQVCTALQEAHAAGIVHRDLKPSNIMLVRMGEDLEFAKVLDFGVAKLEGSELTGTGATFGTPQYMSPEQLRAERVDGRSDLYALGVIIYEMLAGRLPFISPTPIGYVNKHLNEAPPPLRQSGHTLSIPPALEAAVMQLLAKDPAARPQSASQMAKSLQAALGGAMAHTGTHSHPGHAPIGTAPAAAYTPAAYHPPTASGPLTAAPPAPAPARSNMGLILGIGGVLVLLVIGGVIGISFWVHRRMTDLELASNKDTATTANSSKGTNNRDEDPQDTQNSGKKNPQDDDDGDSGDSGTEPDDGIPVANLSPETAELTKLSLVQLEARLDLALEGAILPPSSIRQVKEAYELQKTTSGVTKGQLKTTLVQMIRTYEDNEQLRKKPGDDMSIADLKRVFTSMETKNPMTPEIRKQVLDQTLENMAQNVAKEDVEFYQKLTLANMIRQMAKDPEIIDGAPAGIAQGP